MWRHEHLQSKFGCHGLGEFTGAMQLGAWDRKALFHGSVGTSHRFRTAPPITRGKRMVCRAPGFPLGIRLLEMPGVVHEGDNLYLTSLRVGLRAARQTGQARKTLGGWKILDRNPS